MNGTDEIVTTTTTTTEQTAADNKKSLSLLILLNQTFSKEQKQLILNKLNSSLNQISDPAISSSYLVNLQDEINFIIQANPLELQNFDQEQRISSKNENFEFELLINGTVSSFKRALNQFLQSPTQIKTLIYAGIDYNASSNLVFQDSSYSQDDFHLALNDTSSNDVLKTAQLNLNFNSKYIHENQHWKNLDKSFKNLKFLTPTIALNTEESTHDLTNYLSKFLNERIITDLMEETRITGTLNVEKPALYIFPAREGDCSFFTFNGYSMLINGGYDRVNPSFWRFASMLKHIDSIMITHQDSDALGGLSSFFAKKLVQPTVKPNILSVLGNLVRSKQENIHNDADVVLDAIEELKLKLQPLVKHDQANVKPHQQPEHINLYYKYGYGSLDMYVLSPFANSAEYKEFLSHTQAKVQANVHKSHLNINQTFKSIPISHLCSAVVLLAWTPTKTNENALRILFTGNAPQHVIAHALERVKDFDLLQTPVYKIKGELKEAAAGTASTASVRPVKKLPMNVNGSASVNAGQNGASAASTATTTAKQQTLENGKGDRASLNTSISGSSKPTTNGTSKPAASGSAAAAASKPPNAPKPATSAAAGGNKRESAIHGAVGESKKTDKKPVAAAAAAVTKEEQKEDKDKEVKKHVPSTASRPPVAKKEEAKAKPEKVESTRVSTAPIASKSEHNTKATAPSTATASATKPRPSSAKPAVTTKPEKAEGEKNDLNKKPTTTAAKPPAKATADNKSKPGVKEVKAAAPKSVGSSTTTAAAVAAAPKVEAATSEDKKAESPADEIVKEECKVVQEEVKTFADETVVSVIEQPVEQSVEPIIKAEKVETVQQVISTEQLVQVNSVDSTESVEKVEPVEEVEQVESSPDLNSEEIQLKQDVEALLTQNVHEDEYVTNGDNQHDGETKEGNIVDQEEYVRREEINIQKCEISPSECVPFEPTNEECCEAENAEQYINQNTEETEANVDLIQEAEEDEEEAQDQIASDEVSNLSPLRPSQSKESISSEDDVIVADEQNDNDQRSESPKENLETQACVVAEECSAVVEEVRIDENLTLNREKLVLCLDEPIVQLCVVDNPQELIKTPQHSTNDSPVVENPPNDDVMTRSFIDDGENQAKLFAAVTNEILQRDNDDSTLESGEIDEVSEDHVVQQQQQQSEPADFDNLINGFKSMNIEHNPEVEVNTHNGHNGHNGDHNEHQNGHHNGEETEFKSKTDLLLDFDSQTEVTTTSETVHKSEKQTPTTASNTDPTTWNVLELPKPVIPTETNSGLAVANGTSATDKKSTTPNSKRGPPLSSSSPTATATAAANKKEQAEATKQPKVSLNTSVSKPSSAKQATAPVKSSPIHPLYFEVSYIPAHGSPHYVDSDFFKRVRARFYILSTVDPSQHILNSLLEAKQTWEDKDLQVSIIPTYESDTLRHWFMLNAEQLAKSKIDILIAANLTTLTIDDNPEFAYQVHKLEF